MQKNDKQTISVTSALAHISLFSAVCAILYNISFFSVVDFDSFSLLSLDDHLLSFIQIFPLILCTFFLGLYFDPPWIPEDEDLDNLQRRPGWETMPRWKRRFPALLIGLIFLLLTWIFCPSGDYIYFALPAVIAWVCVFHEFLERSNIKDVFAPRYKWAINIGFLLIIIMFTGMQNGSDSLEADKNRWVEISIANHTEKETGYIIRTATRGVILSDPDLKIIKFLPEAKIERIEMPFREHEWDQIRFDKVKLKIRNFFEVKSLQSK